jgi:hypothetical protein
LARGSAFNGRRLPTTFLASRQARLSSDQAVAATEPFFDEEPIQGFFNRIDPELLFEIDPMDGR